MTAYLVNIQSSYAVEADSEDEALERAQSHGRLIDSDAMVWEE